MPKVTLLTCFLLITYNCLAQDFVYNNYAITEGLPSAEIYDVFQDGKGFLWFASDNGVSKFDGKEITNYSMREGLIDPVVFGFYEDHKGRIWLRTYSGKLSYIQNGKIYKYRFNKALEKIRSSFMYSLYCDGQDKIWLSNGALIVSIDSMGRTKIKEVKKYHFQYLKIDKQDLLAYYGPTNKIKYLNIGKDSFPIHLSDSLKNNHVVRSLNWNKALYITINNDIFEYDGKSVKKVHTGPSHIISFSKDKHNTVWVGYLNGGVSQYKDKSFSNPFSPGFIANKTVTKTLQDHEGGYWFSTLEKGVYYVPNLAIENYPLPIKAKITSIIPVNQNFLIGDQTGNLTLFNPETKKILKNLTTGEPIVKLFNDKRNNFWVSTTTGTYIYNQDLKLEKKSATYCLVGFCTDSNDFIWSVGGTRVFKFSASGDSLLNKKVYVYYRDILVEDSLMYLATRSELQMRDLSLNPIPIPEELKKYRISKLVPLNDSIFFAPTTGSGYLIIKKNTLTFKEFNTTNKFIADDIYTCSKTDSSIWLATEKGIIKLNRQSAFTENPVYKFISKKSGLSSDKINFLVKSNHSIYAFSDNGVSVLPVDRLNFTYEKPIFYLKKASTNNSELNNAELKSLRYNENNIEIAFGFIAFNNQNINIRYRLNTTDKWVYTTDRSILFTSLASHKYNFQLEYAIDNEHWISPLNYNFTINPPWWETWYFYLTVFGIISFFGYVYYKRRLAKYKEKNYYLKVINEHQQKLIQSEIETMERERSRIAKELHDSVGTNLTAIKLRIGQLLKKHNEPVAPDVENDLQLTIKEIKDIIYGLTPSGLERYGLFASLKDYAEKLNSTILTKIDLNVFGNEIIKPELSLLIFRVIQELVSNSIKHSSAKHIIIHINSFEDLLSIVYEDDGTGFSYHSIKKGLGLNNIDSRIQSVNGKLTFESGDFGISYTIDIPMN